MMTDEDVRAMTARLERKIDNIYSELFHGQGSRPSLMERVKRLETIMWLLGAACGAIGATVLQQIW